MKLVKISELFDVKNGNGFELINLEECEKSETSINFISRTEKNNGISAFVKRVPDINPFPANTITVAVGGSVLSTFYQPEPFYTGFHVQILFPKNKYSYEEMLFYAYSIRQNKYRYNYGRQANKTLKNIQIPSVMPESWANLKINNFNTLSRTPLVKNKYELKIQKWREFKLKSLFNITGSKTTPLLELEEHGKGKSPYITTQATNNGVEGFYNYSSEKGNVLTVDSAVLGYCSYQPFDFSASDHVEKLIPKFKLNKYIGQFLVTVINQDQYRYNYGRKSSQTRLDESIIKLPADNNNNPNWQFMEDYIKSLPYSANI